MTDLLGIAPDAAAPSAPLILSSPHSGRHYPEALLAASQVDAFELRRLEDVDVDRLFTPPDGCPLPFLAARYARAYVDLNREAFELDRDLLTGPVPEFVNTASVKARAGLGTVPSRIGSRAIYRERLTFDDVRRRVEEAYRPYHHALKRLIDDAAARFGWALLLDCHSMPGVAPPLRRGAEIDFALGDRFGRSCAPGVVEWAESHLRRRGFRVTRNRPYAGGFITSHYGRPGDGVHVLQIEVRRGLYMNETTLQPLPGFDGMAATMADFLAAFAGFAREATPVFARLEAGRV